jgi:phosphoglycerate-specific signal transduction histidine kinase
LMEPNQVRSLRLAGGECEEALVRVTGVRGDPQIPDHERRELDRIADTLRSAAVQIGNLCDMMGTGPRKGI